MVEAIEWIDADGASLTLDVDWDVEGRFAPPNEFQQDEIPGQPGGRFRAVRHGVREFTMPCLFQDATEAALRAQLRDVVKRMNPGKGLGKVRVTSPIGDVREVNCYVADGLRMLERLGGATGFLSQSVSLLFRAYDPYWYEPSPITQPYTIGVINNFFPFFPIRLTASEIVVDDSATNDGDVETWPTWTITGPGSGIVLHNMTTGKNLTISDTTLTTGESITIDTTPGAKTVIKQDGTSLWSAIDINSSMWPLAPGMNAIRLEMSGAIAGTSGLSVSFKQRYLSP